MRSILRRANLTMPSAALFISLQVPLTIRPSRLRLSRHRCQGHERYHGPARGAEAF
jgi:hypothetical protein